MRHDSGHHRKHVGRYNRKCGGKHDRKYDRKHNAIYPGLAISLHRRERRSVVGINCRHNGWSDRYKRPAVTLSCEQKFWVEV